MENLALKMKISVLWLFKALAALALHACITFMENVTLTCNIVVTFCFANTCAGIIIYVIHCLLFSYEETEGY